MKSDNQLCPLAQAAKLLCERWLSGDFDER